MSKVKLLGTSGVFQTLGLMTGTELLKVDQSGGDGTSAAYLTSSASSSKGHVRIELLDKNNTTVAKANSQQNIFAIARITPVANAAAEGDNGSSPEIVRFNVSPDNFSTGKVIFHISGKLSGITARSELASFGSPDSYKVLADGNGVMTIEMPFEVLA